jgi:disulfide bond formation protein DsbB
MVVGVSHRRHDQPAHVELLAVARLYLVAVTLNVWALVGILAGAFAVQLWSGEPPCPLCVMQRIALMLIALGPLHILLRAHAEGLTSRVVAVGQGMAIIAAVLGALAAGRQILLHILPGDPGFGSPVFGLHLYTWCFITFGGQIVASAVLLITTTWLDDAKARGPMTMVTASVFAFVVAANLVSVVAEAGLHWNLPANPSGYLLLR